MFTARYELKLYIIKIHSSGVFYKYLCCIVTYLETHIALLYALYGAGDVRVTLSVLQYPASDLPGRCALRYFSLGKGDPEAIQV